MTLTPAEKPKLSEKWIVLIVSLVQFVNILDFMMVMPLGPDFARDLHIPMEKIGMIGGTYTLAAFVSGVVGSFFLDRFDRKKALLFSLAGLSIATVAGGLSNGLFSLLVARVAAGFFGGPATATALSIISDVIPPSRRGKAMGTVMLSFSLASILGIPVGLELARLKGWPMPFFAVGALGLVVLILATKLLPTMTGHFTSKHKEQVTESLTKQFTDPSYLLSFSMLGLGIFSTFIMVPNLSAYLQFNLHWPREHMGMLYFSGGLVSIVSAQLGGRLSDKYGSIVPVIIASVLILAILWFGYIHFIPGTPVPLIFAGYMFANNLRFVSFNTLSSKVPAPHLRARFTSVQGAIQHAMSSLGAWGSTLFLTTAATGELVGMPTIATITAVAVLITPIIVYQLEKRVKGRLAH
jgi:predicted MFS family arabinose efflux permease